ncbi:MAG: hypothetical protein ACOH1T_00965 [Microbacteriaceae bacterium]
MNVVAFIISFALFVGGIYMMAESFHVAEGFELIMFLGGILVSSLGIAIPVHVLKRLDA